MKLRIFINLYITGFLILLENNIRSQKNSFTAAASTMFLNTFIIQRNNDNDGGKLK